MNLTLAVSGVPDVLARIQGAPARVEAAAQAVVERYAEIIAREAKGLAPVDTGALRAEIHAELSRLAARIISSKDYSAAVELGRRDNPNYPVQPYLAPALEVHRAGFVRDLRAAVVEALAGTGR